MNKIIGKGVMCAWTSDSRNGEFSELCVWIGVCVWDGCRWVSFKRRIEYDHLQGIKDAPPTKDEDRDQQSSLPRLIGQATYQC